MKSTAIYPAMIGGVSLLALASAHAQEGGARNAPIGARQDSSVDEIVVTAQRREEVLQNIPLSISAFSGEMLQTQGVTNTKDLTIVAPGLNFTQSSYSPQPTIRGIGTRGVSASDESVVPVYIDGIYQPFLLTLFSGLNSVKRVEVLRGPQSALYGRNSTGGAINIITRTPQKDPHFDGSISYGSYNQVIASGYLTGGTDIVQADLAIQYQNDDGYIANLTNTPPDDRGAERTLSVRGKVRVVPTDTLELIAGVFHNERTDNISISERVYNDNSTARRLFPAQYVPTGLYETANVQVSPLESSQDNYSLTGNLDLGGATITSISSYDHTDWASGGDSDGQPADVQSGFTDVFNRSFTQELYATSAGSGALQWIVGATYFHQKTGYDRFELYAQSSTILRRNSQQATNSYAVYAQATYDFTDRLAVTLGGRYTIEKKEFAATNLLATPNISIAADAEFKAFTPSVVIQYRITPDVNVYARVAKGFKAGLFPTLSFETKFAQPETVLQYELGTKFSVEHWLRGSLAVYYSDYKDMQVNVRLPPNNINTTENAGAAEIYGIEGELVATPVHNLNLRLNFTRLHGEFTDFANALAYQPTLDVNGDPVGGNSTYRIPNAKGNRIPRVPEFTISGGVDYTIDLTNGDAISIAANAFHASQEWRDPDNRLILPGYTIVNGEVGYHLSNPDLTISLWARNLLDEHYLVYLLSGSLGDKAVDGRPRTVGVRLDASF